MPLFITNYIVRCLAQLNKDSFQSVWDFSCWRLLLKKTAWLSRLFILWTPMTLMAAPCSCTKSWNNPDKLVGLMFLYADSWAQQAASLSMFFGNCISKISRTTKAWSTTFIQMQYAILSCRLIFVTPLFVPSIFFYPNWPKYSFFLPPFFLTIWNKQYPRHCSPCCC